MAVDRIPEKCQKSVREKYSMKYTYSTRSCVLILIVTFVRLLQYVISADRFILHPLLRVFPFTWFFSRFRQYFRLYFRGVFLSILEQCIHKYYMTKYTSNEIFTDGTMLKSFRIFFMILLTKIASLWHSGSILCSLLVGLSSPQCSLPTFTSLCLCSGN